MLGNEEGTEWGGVGGVTHGLVELIKCGEEEQEGGGDQKLTGASRDLGNLVPEVGEFTKLDSIIN